jgi:acetyl-CoA C-acetyltransferase
LRDRNRLDTSKVDDVVLGCVEPVGEQGADIARVAALYADYAITAPGVTVSRFCASGLEACNQAAAQIMSGQADLVVGGGVESMSRVPMFSSGGAWPIDPQVAAKTYFVPQGISADLIATKWGFSRNDVDAYAVESQRRAKAAWDAGFAKSIVPVKDINGLVMLDHDEYMRPETTLESLAQLKPLPGAGREVRLRQRDAATLSRSRVRSTTCITPATAPASSMAPPPCCSARRRWARRWASSRARGSVPSLRSAPSPRSC